MKFDFLRYLNGIEPESQQTEGGHIHTYWFKDKDGYGFIASICHYENRHFLKLDMTSPKGPLATLIDQQLIKDALDIADTLKKCIKFRDSFPQCSK